MEGSNSLAEEAKPWLENCAKPEVQKAKQIAYEMGSGKLQVVYNSTTEQDDQPKILPQVIASICVAAFHIVVGISMAFSAVMVPQLDQGVAGLHIGKESSSWLVSILVLMAPVGAILAGLIMDNVGRLNTIRLAALPAAVGFIMIASGQSYGMLFAGRLIAGIASSMGTSPAVVYITEVGSPRVRGSLISMCPTLASLGMVIAYSEGYFFTWRTVAWLTLGYIALSVLVISVWIPESPLWLVARGRVDEAERSLKWLSGKNSRLPARQLAMMVKSQDMKALVVAGFFERFRTFLTPAGYKPLAIICGLFVFQQFAGIYSTLFYAVTFFEDIGSGLDPALSTILMGLVRFIMSMCNTGMLKKFGRRPLCMISGCGMAVCLTMSGIFTWKIVNEGMEGVSWIPVTCILLYVVTSMLGLLSIPWTMTAEMFPTDIRGIAQGVVLSVANLLMFATIQTYIDMQRLLGGAAQLQWFYACMALCGSLFVYVFLPETHNKKLVDIENYFKSNWIFLAQRKKAAQENGVVENGVA